MFDNSVKFTKDNIDLYFKELSKEYKRLGGRNIPVEIVLIGGAAIVESYRFRNMTIDIDAIIPAKYPCVLGESNIDSVIENADRKSEDKVSVRATLERFTNEQKPTKQKTEIDRDER